MTKRTCQWARQARGGVTGPRRKTAQGARLCSRGGMGSRIIPPHGSVLPRAVRFDRLALVHGPPCQDPAHVCIHVRNSVYTYACLYTCAHTCARTCPPHTCQHVHMCGHMSAHMPAHIHVYACTGIAAPMLTYSYRSTHLAIHVHLAACVAVGWLCGDLDRIRHEAFMSPNTRLQCRGAGCVRCRGAQMTPTTHRRRG